MKMMFLRWDKDGAHVDYDGKPHEVQLKHMPELERMQITVEHARIFISNHWDTAHGDHPLWLSVMDEDERRNELLDVLYDLMLDDLLGTGNRHKPGIYGDKDHGSEDVKEDI